uniref:Uncharacterized protein n=1 Tax=Chromera velia CCMP2878 TaxID=1169474 RepID=A0A0G4H0R7_9ALVE|eukprot:Cvel_24197.t1-p1 / transcript=Cvel_24197.t1 / gene=Cvel_24197 / organism=Chromera_velia_CCMP2878 / gene_product=hypothetical protein / transcript_product=hypothetical protein / location=Cvel_scaffold2585:1645-2019(+) / protein_length=125 / sequence_SO=supercontig / SO=protein_coding / is_pseudo=false
MALPLPEDDAEISRAIMEECDDMLKEIAANRAYAENVFAANERFQREQREMEENEERRRMDRKRKDEPEEIRQQRVAGWQSHHMSRKAAHLQIPEHKREMRGEDDEEERKKKMVGIDTSYKKDWK